MRRPLLLILASLFILIIPFLAHAETKVLTAEAAYTMGDGETPSFAEAMALQKAKQMALEQAGTYVESYTKVQNLDLTTEEIQTIAGGVLQVEVLDKSRTLIGDGLRFFVKIKATVTTDKMEELAQRVKGKNVAEEYKKVQEDYARLGKELETWKQLVAKTPPGPEREAALDQIRGREKAFAAVQGNEVAFFQRLFSGDALFSEAVGQLSKKQTEKEALDALFRWIITHGYKITHDKPSASTSLKKPGRASVTIPVSVTLTPEAIRKLVNLVEQLGGNAHILLQSISMPGCESSTNAKKKQSAIQPVVLSNDAEIQELLFDLAGRQVLEVRAVKADGSVLFEESQQVQPQRVDRGSCVKRSAEQPRNREHQIYTLNPASSDLKSPVVPIFPLALPTLEELFPGFEEDIRSGRAAKQSNSEILKNIDYERQHLGQKLSSELIEEISGGCRQLSKNYKRARKEEKSIQSGHTAQLMIGMMGLTDRGPMKGLILQQAQENIQKDGERLASLEKIQEEELDRLARQSLTKPCARAQDQPPSQVFLVGTPMLTTIVADVPLDSLALIQDVQARVALRDADGQAK